MRIASVILIFASVFCIACAAEYSSYSTAGHAKAQGMKITVDYPAAWTSRDNPRPGVVHEFRDPSSGGRDALIIVVPSSQPRKATAQEFRRSFGLSEAQERIMPGAHHRKKEFVEGLGFPCVALDYDLEIPQLAPAVAQVRNYIVLIGDKMVQIQFYGVAPPSEDVRVSREELMQHVIRSIKKG